MTVSEAAEPAWGRAMQYTGLQAQGEKMAPTWHRLSLALPALGCLLIRGTEAEITTQQSAQSVSLLNWASSDTPENRRALFSA